VYFETTSRIFLFQVLVCTLLVLKPQTYYPKLHSIPFGWRGTVVQSL